MALYSDRQISPHFGQQQTYDEKLHLIDIYRRRRKHVDVQLYTVHGLYTVRCCVVMQYFGNGAKR